MTCLQEKGYGSPASPKIALNLGLIKAHSIVSLGLSDLSGVFDALTLDCYFRATAMLKKHYEVPGGLSHLCPLRKCNHGQCREMQMFTTFTLQHPAHVMYSYVL